MSKLNLEVIGQITKDLRIPPEINANSKCKNVSPMIMDGETFEDIQTARKICSDCSVKDVCQDWAVWHEPAGVWGGLTPKERKKVRNGKPIFNLEDIRAMQNLYANLFSGKTVEVLAIEYGVTERTIYRWRGQFHGNGNVA